MQKFKIDTYSLICYTAIAVTVAMTPWINSDSLIIPKLMILFSFALFLIPRVIFEKNNLRKSFISKLLVFVSLLIFVDFVLIVTNSPAPIEQQFFGRTGRGLGLATELSLLVIILSACAFIEKSNVNKLLITLVIAVFISSFYSMLQRFGLDIFQWETRTNGIIGTLGNPNFQSSFAAMALVPVLTYYWNRQNGKILSLILALPLIIVIYFSQSTQGYLTSAASLMLLLVIYCWYKNRLAFFITLFSSLVAGAFTVLGMLNLGPLAEYLYKYSIKSRGEFFRTAIRIIDDNKLFGVGLDSIGDNYLMYRSAEDAKGVGEFTDHIHNIYLNYAAVGGFPLATLQLIITVLALVSFFNMQRRIKHFDKNIVALFCAWTCYQLQSLISPANISMLTWNAIITGSLIGLNATEFNNSRGFSTQKELGMQLTKPFSNFLLIIGLIVMLPLFNVDRQVLLASRTGDGTLALRAVQSYPESTIRYSRVGQEFIKSNLAQQALEIGRAAAKFNPNAASAWGLILVNNLAPREERLKAQQELLRLDPFNDEIRSLVIPESIAP